MATTPAATAKKYNFLRGHPSASLLPSKEILQATTTISTNVINDENYYDDAYNRHPLQYGPDLGNLEVRQTIAKWNDTNFKLSKPTNVKCINMTNGASYGIMNILTQTTSPHNNLTRRAFLVTPTYHLMNTAFIDAGFGEKLTGIEELTDGQIDLDSLKQQLEYYDSLAPIKSAITYEDIKSIQSPMKPLKKIYRYVFYVVPTLYNPRGGTLSLETRKQLIELAKAHDMLIISDDVYDILDYSCVPEKQPEYAKRLVCINRETMTVQDGYGNTVSNCTFSKIRVEHIFQEGHQVIRTA
ncbi:unnamed protein product [Ambrosiozyma monospora]|uniref:Unnamed protein product n=1 Tax=Ambrosiozyma monospora TaxID=43982 RepID=A0ACB5TWR0_AMBMO|nr:unnamed protein product [Ambrosiozyma monospora]